MIYDNLYDASLKAAVAAKRLWFELYGSRDGITDPRSVPGDLYFSGLLPRDLQNVHKLDLPNIKLTWR